jgi:hypothetical protein
MKIKMLKDCSFQVVEQIENDDIKDVRFGEIKRGQRFMYHGQSWVRTQGRFALPVRQLGTGQAGWPIDLDTKVCKVA